MRQANAPESAVRSFRFHYQRLLDGDRGLLAEDSIRPTPALRDSEDFDAYVESGRTSIPEVVIVKLNGGLGTSMGLDRAKSLLPVRDDLSFLDLIARQVLSLREETESEIPLLMMNSFRTARDTDAALAKYPDLVLEGMPLGFVQNMVPKVLEDGLTPAVHDTRPQLGWCPPGHGDFFTAIEGSGMLDLLLERGVRYAFISNADNLGAVISPSLLGYMVTEGFDFMLEAADRTPADRKGGHLCSLPDGRLALRESAQCPPGDADSFQDVQRHRYFNTNNLWIHLPTLQQLLEEHRGVLPLPTVVNRKNLDPRNPSSPHVFQLETVMGTAISLFPRATAVRVGRHRFSPVKNTNDLLGVRSDAYELSSDGRIVLATGRIAPPVIRLDERYFKMIDAFDERFPFGPPSLLRCYSFSVEGDVTFGAGVSAKGDAAVRATTRTSVPDGTRIRDTVVL